LHIATLNENHNMNTLKQCITRLLDSDGKWKLTYDYQNTLNGLGYVNHANIT